MSEAGGPLPRSTPVAEGVDAEKIIGFLDAVEATRTDFHSLMVVRHGSVVAEGWWAPYRADDIQLLYSLSKMFLAMAVGLAIGEGRFGLDDLVADLLPDLVPDPRPPHLEHLRVRHLLSMASGHTEEMIFQMSGMGPDLVRNFLALAPPEPPGSVFAYNQGNPLTLSQLITTFTGEQLVDYLRPRLFAPLGIERAEWSRVKMGIDQGFSGLHVETEALAKLGLLVLQDGRWGDEQLVPADYVRACRTHQIPTVPESSEVDAPSHAPVGDIDWMQGYGYQMWMCRHGAARGDGAYGQYSIVLPELDAVIACTAAVIEMQPQLELIWEHLLPAFAPDVYEAAPARGIPSDASGGADGELAERLSQLSTARVRTSATGPAEAIELAPTEVGWPYLDGLERVRVEPLPRSDGTGGAGSSASNAGSGDSDSGSGDSAATPGSAGGQPSGGSRLTITVAGVAHRFDVPDGEWVDGELTGLHTVFPEVAVSAGWVGVDEFQADVVSRRTPHRLQLRLNTAGDEPTLSAGWQTIPMPVNDL